MRFNLRGKKIIPFILFIKRDKWDKYICSLKSIGTVGFKKLPGLNKEQNLKV
jgi:hypothetical protein